jgi:hypothetical protein
VSPDWKRVQALFDEALLRDPGERRSFIDEATASDPELGREVASLLEAHGRAGDLLEAPALHSAAHLFVDEVDRAPEAVGPYIIRHELGRGGMGVVYLADDTRLSRRVALKAIPRSVSGDPIRRERLRQEARATAALSHPGIATVFALEEFDGELYIASEYVPGQTLKTVAASAPVSMAMVVDIAAQMARAMAAAHALGIVHRDLKPENVMRTGGGVIKILDFGVARFDGPARTGLTESGALVGTIGYMAPEQIRGEHVDVRADLFSYGVLIYEMAAGANPLDGGSPGATIARTLEHDPPPLSEVCDDCPPALARIVGTCLRKDPMERFMSAVALVTELEGVQADVRAHRGDDNRSRLTPLWWWEFHQLVVSCIYVLALLPAWSVRAWIPQPWGMLLLFAVLGCVATAATLRLHLWFSARFYLSELAEQRIRALPWTRRADAGFAALQLVAALVIGDAHPEVAVLLIAVATSTLVAAFMIEPVTARAAFDRP